MARSYPRIIDKVMSTAWMITPDALQMMLELMEMHLKGEISQDDIRVRLSSVEDDGRDRHIRSENGIGILPISGPIFPKANLMTELSGATSVEQMNKDFRTMMNDPQIRGVLLDIDSPGGASDMIPEMADQFAKASKPVWAIANTAMNSAAYYLGSQAEQVFATPSAQLGSIGTFLVHKDKSVQDEKFGIKNTVIKAGLYKAVGQEPLTEDGRSYLQNYVDEVNAQFINAVASGRNVDPDSVIENFGQGGIVTPTFALEAGMIDGIETFDTVLAKMQESLPPVGFAYSGGTRQSYDADKEHSEPGTGQGGEPTPRTPPEEGDKAIKGGWRRETPQDKKEEGQAMDRAQLETLAGKLGVKFAADISDEDLTNLVLAQSDETITPLAEAAADARAAKDFRKDYPEQFEELQTLKTTKRENAAKDFARQFERIDGTSLGLSALLLDKVEEVHMKVAERTFMIDDLNDLVTSLLDENAKVKYGEEGSTRSDEPVIVRAGASRQEIRQQTADEIRKIMEADEVDEVAAMKMLAKSNPDLAAAYFEN